MRNAYIHIDTQALLHNLKQVQTFAPTQKVIAMVKANAYGCGLAAVVPVLEPLVDGFGVACLEEALAVRALGSKIPCVLFEGVFSAQDYSQVAANDFLCVIHQFEQVEGLLATPLSQKIKIWIKVDTGMHRLGFAPEVIPEVFKALRACPWVDEAMVLMTHFSSADLPENPATREQLAVYRSLVLSDANLPPNLTHSLANSAAILFVPESHGDWVRPGIMLYGASPSAEKIATDLGLKPVMQFKSMLIALQHYKKGARVGYAGTWEASRDSLIGVVAVGYGDGYPRHIARDTPVCVHGELFPIVGRVSMDMITVDLTDCQKTLALGDEVELWGEQIPIERIAEAAGTIAYELMCQITARVYRR